MIRILPLFLTLMLIGCRSNPNIDVKVKEHTNTLISYEETPTFDKNQDVYVSAYSNLYYMDGANKVYYTVILSLRNISFSDTLYFTDIDYYDSDGVLLKEYLKDEVLVLHPMESVEYIVGQTDRSGGAGANFVVSYGVTPELRNKPLIEAVMSGTISHHGFAFRTPGVEIIR